MASCYKYKIGLFFFLEVYQLVFPGDEFCTCDLFHILTVFLRHLCFDSEHLEVSEVVTTPKRELVVVIAMSLDT